MKKSLKIFLTTSLTSVAVIALTAGITVATKSHPTEKLPELAVLANNQNLKYKNYQSLMFELQPGRVDPKQSFASAYVEDPIFKTNSEITANNKYWENLLLPKKILTKSEQQNQDFYITTSQAVPLNVFKDAYNIQFKSFANDLEGVLYLRVSFVAKDLNKNLTPNVTTIYKLSGFKKITLSDVTNTIFLKNDATQLRNEQIDQYQTFTALKEAYQKLQNDSQKRAEFIENTLVLAGTSDTARIDYRKTEVSFEDPNVIKINFYLAPLIKSATLTDLNSIQFHNTEGFYTQIEKTFHIEKFK
ncbi:hypothetical protein BCF59_0113 [Mycoplasmopsis mustelae]|uniref:Uncharacterized protein n=1 Tax=Mycoplasmopsis mustelae TaxID=171289 RepID=A0A4R7UEW3_9BACT|nr:hypothetical protein [Mycoplasmopsis mustelae]TDV24165.1 hypothetical protein BCF59_0113 [Mycoplasmopsis mustelae]